MKFNYFDIHSHLNLTPLLENKDEIINTLRQHGMGTITVGVDYDTSLMAVNFANENSDILWSTVGQHPVDGTSKVLSDSEWAKFKELARNDKVVAIGECGLDYFRLKPARNASGTADAGGGSEDEKQIEVERQKDLHDFAQKKLREMHLRPKFQSFGDGFAGLPTFAPFDKILVTCGAEILPTELLKQQDIDGLLVGGASLDPGHFLAICEQVSEQAMA